MNNELELAFGKPMTKLMRRLYINLDGKVTECFIEEFWLKLDKIVSINGVCDISNAFKRLRITTANKSDYYKEMTFEQNAYLDLYDNVMDCHALSDKSYIRLTNSRICLNDLKFKESLRLFLGIIIKHCVFWEDISKKFIGFRIGPKKEKLMSYAMSSCRVPEITSSFVANSYYDIANNLTKTNADSLLYYDSKDLCVNFNKDKERQELIDTIPVEHFSHEEKEEQIVKCKRNNV